MNPTRNEFEGQLLPPGVEVRYVEEWELTAEHRKAFGLPPTPAKGTLLKNNVDLVLRAAQPEGRAA